MSEGRISRKKFIRLGTVVGLGSAAVPLVSACGGGGSSTGSGESASAPGAAAGSTGGAGPEVGERRLIVKESEVAPNTAFPFTESDTGQQSVLVRLENGDFVAYSAICTHQSCVVAYKEGQLACPCHGSVFDPTNGARPTTGPAQRPLPEVPIRVEGGEVVRV